MNSVFWTIVGAAIIVVLAFLQWLTSQLEPPRWDKRVYSWGVLLAALFTAYGSWSGFLLNEEKRWQQEQSEFDARWSQLKQLKERARYERELRTKADEIAALSQEQLQESTGGESFCYLDMGTMGENLVANIVQKGRYPVFQVRVAITDTDALAAAFKSGNPDAIRASRHSFPVIDFVSRASLFLPLTSYQLGPTVEHKRFLIEIFARNGAFTEFLHIKRLDKGRGWTWAQLVYASFLTTKRRGIVFEQIHREFPAELLKADQDWMTFKKSKVIKVPE